VKYGYNDIVQSIRYWWCSVAAVPLGAISKIRECQITVDASSTYLSNMIVIFEIGDLVEEDSKDSHGQWLIVVVSSKRIMRCNSIGTVVDEFFGEPESSSRNLLF